MVLVENVLESKPLVMSGTFRGMGSPGLTLPGETVSIRFSAAKGQAITFAAMYGWSNDLFFAPENPGIQVYNANGNPVEGDVSAQVKLWDNGTRINQAPGPMVSHPGMAEAAPRRIMEVNGADAQGNTYLPAASLVKVSLQYEGNSIFKLTIKNTSGGTANETPLSPGVWALSYSAGGNLLDKMPLYERGKPSANGLTSLAEAGDNSALETYTKSITGIFTPLSPVLVVIYNGISNPIYQEGMNDAGRGLKDLAQKGDATQLATYLKTLAGVKDVYVLAAANTTVLLPVINGQKGGSVSQQLSNLRKGDKIAIATMYGLSNDWFFATKGDIDATAKGDLSMKVGLYDNGTGVDQFPGAGNNQVAFGGMPVAEHKPITGVPNPNAFTTLPDINKIIKVTLR